jgi:hypothetical protein
VGGSGNLRGVSKLAAYEPPNRFRSKLAVQAEDLNYDRDREERVFGLCVHTSSRSIIQRAKRKRLSPIKAALDYYQSAEHSAHYLCGYDGTIYQISDDDKRVTHIGVSKSERKKYLSGAWEKDFPKSAVSRWRERWPRYKSPQHLYPGSSANEVYVGCEMIPLAKTRQNGLWFTDEQHEAMAALSADIANRHSWPDGWQFSPRLIGHEDVDAYGRWRNLGTGKYNAPWDPGGLRAKPRFSWDVVLGLIS